MNVRPRVLRQRLFLVFLGGLCTAALISMPESHADGILSNVEAAYVNTYHNAVCSTIDKYPTEDGVLGVLEGIMSDGFTADSAVDVINASVEGFCDEHWPLLKRIGAKARGENQISRVWHT